jgi:hypothetical protein
VASAIETGRCECRLLLSLLRVPASLVIANGQERAEAFADKAACAVGGDEIQSVGEVLTLS